MTRDDQNKTNEDYKHILATANRLETIQSNIDSVIDFFIAPVTRLNTKLCHDSIRLFFGGHFKLDQFRKVEELIWRRVYHDIYKFQKSKKQSLRKQDVFLVEAHFISGVGFYSSLIVQLRTVYRIKDAQHVMSPLNWPIGPMDNFIDCQQLNDDQDREKTGADTSSMKLDPTVQQWARCAIYRSLVYIGDLARYLLEMSDHNFRDLSFRSYISASRFQPEFGLPFNQLATLVGGLNHNLDAVCNYMRSCLRGKPFEGAEGNMMKIFELNDKYYEELIVKQDLVTASEILASKNPVHDAEMLIRSVILIYIRLVSRIWQALCGKYDTLVQDSIVQETRLFFETLREAIDVEPIVPLASLSDDDTKFQPVPGKRENPNQPRFISPTVMYELASIAIMLIAKCQKEAQQVSSNNLIELTNTIALNLIHYATTRCQKMIIRKIQDLRLSGLEREIMKKPTSESSLKDMTGNSSISSLRSCDNINSFTSRRNKSRLRNKKAASNYSDGKTRLISTNDSDLSELEETALSTIDALDISSEMSEGDDYQDLINLDSSSGLEDDSCHLSRPAIRSSRSQNYELGRPKPSTDRFSLSQAPDLLTGDLEFHSITLSLRTPISPVKKSRVFHSKNKSSHHGEGQRLNTALEYIYLQTYLPTIKILFDWLLSNIEVIDSNLCSFISFNDELTNIAKLLKEVIKLGQLDDFASNGDPCESRKHQVTSSIYIHKFDDPEWVQRFPLSCDFPLINMAPLKSVHDINIDFNCPKELNNAESGYLVAQCIFAFAHALSSFLENKKRYGVSQDC